MTGRAVACSRRKTQLDVMKTQWQRKSIAKYLPQAGQSSLAEGQSAVRGGAPPASPKRLFPRRDNGSFSRLTSWMVETR